MQKIVPTKNKWNLSLYMSSNSGFRSNINISNPDISNFKRESEALPAEYKQKVECNAQKSLPTTMDYSVWI